MEGTTLTLQSASQEFEPVGVYRILRKVGEGGMGVVYEAEQERPLRRKVALKQIKWGMDTREVVARFESERQALALMNHPNIARVYDAGATETGRPFFVMEYVSGVPLTQYCDARRLSTEERLRLFTRVCEGVQHAHQKGVIHRDLKPSNVLVSLQDNVPVPKIIDFGVAKATTQRLTEKTLYTGFGQVVGTPAYMSPEQAQMTGLDVDTRSDVYSLGVMLYELLVGALPFPPETAKSLEELRRAVVEQEPPRPSARVSSMRAEVSGAAALQRRTDPLSLTRRLRGDLDWIVLKALEKDPTRRYASASELSADIARHLNHEPVQAGHPGAAYRLKKFVRRHRLGVAAGAIVAIALLAGIVGTTLSMLRARRAEARARMEADTARRVQDFLVDLFKVSDPSEARGKTITAREILDRGAKGIEAQLKGEPLIQARMMDTIGAVYKNLGLSGSAETLLEQAEALQRRSLGPFHPDLAATLAHLGALRWAQGRIEECTELQNEALGIRKKALGEGHVDTGWSYYYLGGCLEIMGRHEEAVDALRRSIAIFEQALGPNHYSVAWGLTDLAGVFGYLEQYDVGELYLQRALRIKEHYFGPNHPDVGIAMNGVGWNFMLQGKYTQAEPFLRRAVDILQQTLEPGHTEITAAQHSLGELLRRMGRYKESESILRQALANADAAGLHRSHRTGEVLRSLAQVAEATGENADAELYFQDSLAVISTSMGPDHPLLAESLMAYANFLRSSGRESEAVRLEKQANDIRVRNGLHAIEKQLSR